MMAARSTFSISGSMCRSSAPLLRRPQRAPLAAAATAATTTSRRRQCAAVVRVVAFKPDSELDAGAKHRKAWRLRQQQQAASGAPPTLPRWLSGGFVKQRWQRVQNKAEAIAFVFGTCISAYVAGAALHAIERLPLVPEVMQLVGFSYSLWFALRYLVFAESRRQLQRELDQSWEVLQRRDVVDPSTVISSGGGVQPPPAAAARQAWDDTAAALPHGAAPQQQASAEEARYQRLQLSTETHPTPDNSSGAFQTAAPAITADTTARAAADMAAVSAAAAAAAAGGLPAAAGSSTPPTPKADDDSKSEHLLLPPMMLVQEPALSGPADEGNVVYGRIQPLGPPDGTTTARVGSPDAAALPPADVAAAANFATDDGNRPAAAAAAVPASVNDADSGGLAQPQEAAEPPSSAAVDRTVHVQNETAQPVDNTAEVAHVSEFLSRWIDAEED